MGNNLKRNRIAHSQRAKIGVARDDYLFAIVSSCHRNENERNMRSASDLLVASVLAAAEKMAAWVGLADGLV